MSIKLVNHRKMLSAICKECGRILRYSDSSRSTAMQLAWGIIRCHIIKRYTKLKGVRYNNRQRLLQHLLRYEEKNIRIFASRDYGNIHDQFAAEVICKVKNKGSSSLGYFSKFLARSLAPLMDEEGVSIILFFEQITGIHRKDYSFGLNISYIIVE